MTTGPTFVEICQLGNLKSHTRFSLSLRTKEATSTYHKLLLFKISSTDDENHGKPELYCMEAVCPHLGAPLSHAPIEDMEDTKTIVCPWHQYDFDLKDGSSSTGMNACVYQVRIDGNGPQAMVSIEAPPLDRKAAVDFVHEVEWELVEMKGVSEDFADPPAPSMASLSIGSNAPEPPIASSNRSNRPAATLPEQLPSTLLAFANLILATASPVLKCLLTRECCSRLRSGQLKSIRPSKAEAKREKENLLETPPREADAVSVWDVKKRGKGGSEKSRILMLHALANIEQYAIDLAWDIIARFADTEINGERLPVEFFLDWAKVAEDEAKHFTLLNRRLEELGSYFGAHTVHAGLWESALETAHSLSARIAIIHLVAEARGLDVNPLTIEKFRRAPDAESVRILDIIHADEITHVTTGHRWFSWLCAKQQVDPVQTFRDEVSLNFRGKIKGPFNAADRLKAGMTEDYYLELEGHGFKKHAASQRSDGDERLHPRLT